MDARAGPVAPRRPWPRLYRPPTRPILYGSAVRRSSAGRPATGTKDPMPDTPSRPLRTEGTQFVDADGRPIRLKGVNVGGWLNMENFITGYAANESMMRAAVREVLGPALYEHFFDRLLSAFYADADAAFLASIGL